MKKIIILVLMVSMFFSCKLYVYEIYNQNNEKISELCQIDTGKSFIEGCFIFKKTDKECGVE